jgi:hypothetical protein
MHRPWRRAITSATPATKVALPLFKARNKLFVLVFRSRDPDGTQHHQGDSLKRLAQDYVSGLFVDDSLGRFPSTLPLSSINLKGTAMTPMPAIAVNFRTFSTGCDQASNADVGMTLARILGLDVPRKGELVGRVLTEAMPKARLPGIRPK